MVLGILLRGRPHIARSSRVSRLARILAVFSTRMMSVARSVALSFHRADVQMQHKFDLEENCHARTRQSLFAGPDGTHAIEATRGARKSTHRRGRVFHWSGVLWISSAAELDLNDQRLNVFWALLIRTLPIGHVLAVLG